MVWSFLLGVVGEPLQCLPNRRGLSLEQLLGVGAGDNDEFDAYVERLWGGPASGWRRVL
jgi:hypothetical protein